MLGTERVECTPNIMRPFVPRFELIRVKNDFSPGPQRFDGPFCRHILTVPPNVQQCRFALNLRQQVMVGAKQGSHFEQGSHFLEFGGDCGVEATTLWLWRLKVIGRPEYDLVDAGAPGIKIP